MSAFASKLTRLCAHESFAAQASRARKVAMIEALAAALGSAVALAARGDPAVIDRLLQGVEAHALETAADTAAKLRAAQTGGSS